MPSNLHAPIRSLSEAIAHLEHDVPRLRAMLHDAADPRDRATIQNLITVSTELHAIASDLAESARDPARQSNTHARAAAR